MKVDGRIQYDTHVHTMFSTDSVTPMRSQLDRAKQLHLKGICFTDHIDYDFQQKAVRWTAFCI